MSVVLSRNVAEAGTAPNDYNQGAFDTLLVIYNSSGQVIAYNDDSFQDSDSTIIDLTLPYTGTYYAMVTSSPKSASLGEPLTGDYELFMYTFSAGTTPASTPGTAGPGDSLYAGSGDDTIIAGTGDDTVAAQLPADTLIYGSGTVNLISKAPYLDVAITGANSPTISVGQSILLGGTFADPEDADAHSYDWSVNAGSAQGPLVADGTDSTFMFTPESAGIYVITYDVYDTDGGLGTASIQITATASPVYVTPPSSPQSAVEGMSTSFDLGQLNDSATGTIDVSVQWGDQQTSSFTVTAGGPLAYSHAYFYEGDYTITETVTDAAGDTTTIMFPYPVVVADQAVVPASPVAVTAVVGVPTGNVLVAQFTDPEGPDLPSAYMASVSSSDPNFTTGNITYADGVFSVYAELTFDQAGDDTVTVTISHGNAETTTIVTTVDVAQAVTTTSVATPSSIVYGQSAIWTATVTGYDPTGSVSFYFGAVNPADLVGTAALFVLGNVDEAVLNVSGLPAGPGYPLTAVYNGDTNNIASQSSEVTQVVTPAPLSITAEDVTMTYGGTMPGIELAFSGLVNNDTPQIVIGSPNTAPSVSTAPATSNVGSYAIDVSGAVDRNYDIMYVSGTLTINPAAISYTIGNDTQAYGSAANFAADLPATIGTGINGENLDITYSSLGDTTTADVGTYKIAGTVSNGTGLASNYTVSLTRGTLTVNPAPISYTIAGDSHVYGTVDSFSTLAQTIATGINGQNLDIAYSSTGNTATADVGSSSAITGTISSGTGEASDYCVTLTSGNLTVTPYAFSYTIANDSHVYGTVDPFSTLAPTIATGINGQNLDIAYSSTGNTATADVGSSSAITGRISSGTGLASDYCVTLTSGNLTVTPYAFSYTIANDSHVYGTVDPFSTLAHHDCHRNQRPEPGHRLQQHGQHGHGRRRQQLGHHRLDLKRHRPRQRLQRDAHERQPHCHAIRFQLHHRQHQPRLRHRRQLFDSGADDCHRNQRPEPGHRLQQYGQHGHGRRRQQLGHHRLDLKRHRPGQRL